MRPRRARQSEEVAEESSQDGSERTRSETGQVAEADLATLMSGENGAYVEALF